MCSEIYKNQRALVRHMKFCDGTKKQGPNFGNIYACKYCGEVRGGKTQLSLHITECHALLPSARKRKIATTDIADIPEDYDYCGEETDSPIIDGGSIEENDLIERHIGKKSRRIYSTRSLSKSLKKLDDKGGQKDDGNYSQSESDTSSQLATSPKCHGVRTVGDSPGEMFMNELKEEEDSTKGIIPEEQQFVEEFVRVGNEEEAINEVTSWGLQPQLKEGEYDFSLQEQHRTHLDKGYDLIPQNSQFACQVKLLSLLKQSGTALKYYDEIMKWSYQSAVKGRYKFQTYPSSRSTLMAEMLKKNNLGGLLPKTIEFQLPRSKKTVRITTHDIRQAIYSLLSDPVLMEEENLIFHDDLFEEPVKHSNVLNDINDGDAYYAAYQVHVKQKRRDVLCPIILFIDKTHTDQHGKLTLEPVTMTLGIFNLNMRRRPQAWRTIGYIPNMAKIEMVNMTSTQKQEDYHAMLNVIVTPLAKLQQLEGIAWKMMYKNKVHQVVFKIPVLFISGDSVGHDQLVGRTMSYANANFLCRCCNCPAAETGNPYFKFKPTKQSKIERLLLRNDTDGLEAMGYINIRNNALHQLIFCDTEQGVNGSTPAELLHTFQHGTHLYAVKGLFKQKKYNVKASKAMKKKVKDKAKTAANKKAETTATIKDKETANKRNSKKQDNNSDEDTEDDGEEIFEPLDGDSKSTHNVFSKEECDHFDRCTKVYGQLLQRQSDNDLPRCYFTEGITKNSKKMGMKCRVLFCYVSSCSSQLNLKNSSTYLAMIVLLISLICLNT
jgi:hypothetical protein